MNAMVKIDYSKILPRQASNEEMELYHACMREFSEEQFNRNIFAAQWEEIAALILTSHVNTFFYGSTKPEGVKNTLRQIDASGQMALSRFCAICDSLLTPRNRMWHALSANDDYVMKDRNTQLWFERVTKILFKHRYAPIANFSSQNQAIFQSLGAFGTGSMFVDRPAKQVGLRYMAVPLGQTYFRQNHQGLIIACLRHFKMTAAQAEGMWPGMLPIQLQTALQSNSTQKFNFIHHVCPREDWDQDRADYKGKPYRSYYLSIEGQCLMFNGGSHYEEGYTSFPYSATRFDQAPDETYGRSPAMLVLPSLKTLNAQKAVFLKQGHRASDPVLLTADDGLLDLDMRPGALNKGGVSGDGKRLVDILPTGEIQINEKMMEMEKVIINDAFFVTLFQILTETPQMTATEVIERTNEKGILLAPTIGRQQSEYLGPLIDRELDLLASQGLLPPMPPRLKEARGAYEVVYTSPLSRAARAQEAAGFMRTVESVKELVNITQDPSLLDPFNFDVAIPAIAEIQAVPESWMADPQMIAQKRQNRAQAQQKQQAIQAMPAQAAMMKAQAVQAKAGMQQPEQQGVPQ